jgi:hypothetical protein
LNYLTVAVCFAHGAQQITAADIYKQAHLSVVVVLVGDGNSNVIGQGSGFIVAKNRIVTNHHVVNGAKEALVVFADGASELVEGLAVDSPAEDLAILVVNTGSRLPLKLGAEDSVRQDDSVYALGAPRGLESSFTNGIVSGFRDLDGHFRLQTTVPIAPGSSGGPLFNSSGRVIGVTTELLADSPGIYFSIGVTDVKRLLRTPNLALTPFSLGSRENRAEAESAAKISSDESEANSSANALVPPSKSLSPLANRVWKNLRDGQTYRTRSNGDELYLESVDDYLARVGDLISCEFSRTVSNGSDWKGICAVRNPKDQSSYKSTATITVFSEMEIEGSTEYISEFVMIPVDAPSLRNGQLVPGGSASRGGIHIDTDVVGATAVLHGAAGRVFGKCQTPCSFNDLFPSRYTMEIQKQGYRSVEIALRVMAGKEWNEKVDLTNLATEDSPKNLGPSQGQESSTVKSSSRSIAISSRPPGADVFVNGIKQSAQTPVTLQLEPGQYNLVLRLGGYEPYSGNIQVNSDIQTQLNVALIEKSTTHLGWVLVSSNPKGAEILVDGASTGQVTPAWVETPEGVHRVTLRLNGYRPTTRTVQLSEGGTVTVDESLRQN